MWQKITGTILLPSCLNLCWHSLRLQSLEARSIFFASERKYSYFFHDESWDWSCSWATCSLLLWAGGATEWFPVVPSNLSYSLRFLSVLFFLVSSFLCSPFLPFSLCLSIPKICARKLPSRFFLLTLFHDILNAFSIYVLLWSLWNELLQGVL